MMRMLLASGPVRDESAVHAALLDLIGRPLGETRSVVVLDAMLPLSGDKTTMLEHLRDFRDLGWAECDILTLQSGPPALIEQRLRHADVIFGYGGTNHWLAHAWRSTGLAALLRELLDEKVYLGLSAGSMIFSRHHERAAREFGDLDEPRMLGLDEIAPALPLLDWYLAPHLGADYFPHQTDAWAAGLAPRLGAPMWFLDDASALIVRDPDAEPEIVSDGHWLHFDASGALVGSDASSRHAPR
ncbi:Type 1 glutamine amidotransferase-like domain-containing protein [Schumannella sp. 10F1B-5-1]|uniref:Type 1 glutamine amidotransferase-like domain-containing protein n=1 Tax=Schumannella sp. 10F1B-5-1 TaxID=2590780 RepID=UPI0011325116|nr:Type 1 glutamine amidotransferase-like domain-containing protein [Schumannella sp. 10F1B-5-1]TPW76835.1 peptidase E [Schumannella sp. 10F1B-5-1]